MRNKGDAFYCTLTIKVNGTDITQNQYDEIELQVNEQYNNGIKKLLSSGDLEWDSSINKFKIYFSQEDTFNMKETNKVDIRLYTANDDEPLVISAHASATLSLDYILSRKVLEDGQYSI